VPTQRGQHTAGAEEHAHSPQPSPAQPLQGLTAQCSLSSRFFVPRGP